MKLSETLLIDIIRGSLIESEHLCDCAVVDASGDVIMAWGDVDREMYPRSAIKPVLSLPLVESGAAEKFNYSEAEVSLACASHNSETIHVNTVDDVLSRIGLGEPDLECGAHRPYHEPSSDEMIRQGVEPSRLHNNCSGKHMGFLSTAVHLGEAAAGYIGEDHPVQERLLDVMAGMSGYDLSGTSRGIDGCGIPVVGMPLTGLARSMARMADPVGLGPVREAAAKRIVAAMIAQPHMVAGNNRIDSFVMKALGNVALKAGAEGVQIAIIPTRGLGIAVKARDGNSRASEVATMWILNKLGLISDSAAKEISQYMSPVLKNRSGTEVGKIRVHESNP